MQALRDQGQACFRRAEVRHSVGGKAIYTLQLSRLILVCCRPYVGFFARCERRFRRITTMELRRCPMVGNASSSGYGAARTGRLDRRQEVSMHTRTKFAVAVVSFAVLLGFGVWVTSSTGTALAATTPDSTVENVSPTPAAVDPVAPDSPQMDWPWCCCPQPIGCIRMSGCGKCSYVGDQAGCAACAMKSGDEESVEADE